MVSILMSIGIITAIIGIIIVFKEILNMRDD